MRLRDAFYHRPPDGLPLGCSGGMSGYPMVTRLSERTFSQSFDVVGKTQILFSGNGRRSFRYCGRCTQEGRERISLLWPGPFTGRGWEIH